MLLAYSIGFPYEAGQPNDYNQSKADAHMHGYGMVDRSTLAVSSLVPCLSSES